MIENNANMKVMVNRSESAGIGECDLVGVGEKVSAAVGGAVNVLVAVGRAVNVLVAVGR